MLNYPLVKSSSGENVRLSLTKRKARKNPILVDSLYFNAAVNSVVLTTSSTMARTTSCACHLMARTAVDNLNIPLPSIHPQMHPDTRSFAIIKCTIIKIHINMVSKGVQRTRSVCLAASGWINRYSRNMCHFYYA